MLRISNLKCSINENVDIVDLCSKKLNINKKEIVHFNIFKKSLDARKKENIQYVYVVDIIIKNEKKILAKKLKDVSSTPDFSYKFSKCNKKNLKNPVIVGFGPAGMFSALLLAQMGFCPIVFERGEDVDSRTKSVYKFWNYGILNEESNVQFGEGGAGTFSDGKLTSRTKDLRCRKVLEEFVNFGANSEILYEQKPHIGTDILKVVVKNIRNEIIKLGGIINFRKKVIDFIIEDNAIKGLFLEDGTIYECNDVILAIGHSARDTFEILNKNNIKIEQKPFAIGVRIEHKQEMINVSQYGRYHNILPAADYKLTYTTKNGRGVYTFCMCPGGSVVASSSEYNTVVTNGMSEYARDGQNANSALLVQVYKEDFNSNNVFAGMYMQREIEQKAFLYGGKNYFAPVQTIGAFLNNRVDTFLGDIKNSYKPGVNFVNLRDILPNFITESLLEAIPEMGKKLIGFDRCDSLITGVETRSSSPIRILRDSKTYESISVKGLYPVGEGAGYAGGIISSAIDGIIVAEKIFDKYNFE